MEEKRITAKTVVGIVIFVALLAVLVMVVMRGIAANKALEETAESPAVTVQPTPTPTPEPTPTPVGLPDFKPHSVDGTEPERLISSTAIMVDGEVVEQYESDYEINFDLPERYTELEGIVTFRGDNFRSGAAYGTAAVSSKTLTKVWSKSTSGLSDTDGIYWSGSGWTGQPLIVKWPEATRKNISAMYDWAREKEGLVEVIYATLDGHVYFYELTSGEYTRVPLNLGSN